ncbi:cobaltochelatase CobT-related protein [Brevundimonas naejangsanensis]|uniref:cobaltochelatase CobT-related protein n=1 Tax=Brevundimonas naejangsanensis TaxID=588932 RepID=UPI00320B38DD
MASDQAHEYRVFTTKFDREVSWDELDGVLGPLSTEDTKTVDASFAEFETALTASVETPAGQVPATDLEIGAPPDTAITLLLDQSGSMRGAPMAFAAAAIAQAVRRLRAAGCRVEVLGFTTASWRGGRPRRRWKWWLRPRLPGRLCELLHIVYRDGDDEGSEISGAAIRSMLRPDLPKENIDGEAIAWAAGRLLARPETAKTMLVLSDGSPLDDSTQQANGPMYLDAHLQSVLDSIRREGQIQIGAVGIGYDVSGWYPESISVQSADDLASSLCAFLDRLLSRYTR